MSTLLTEQWVADATVWRMLTAALAAGLCGWYGGRFAQIYTALIAKGRAPDGATFQRALVGAVRAARKPSAAADKRLVYGGSLAMACAGCALYLRYGVSLYFFALTGLVLALLVLAFIDSICGLLPDALTWPLMWTGVFMAWLGHGPTLHQAVAGVFLGYLFPWGIFFVYKCARGIHGMGHGDFKLLAALGAWLGWQAVGPVLLGASVATIVAAMWHQKTLLPRGAYPFGPFLIVSAAGFFMGGSALHSWFI